jgi:hypothetical protein
MEQLSEIWQVEWQETWENPKKICLHPFLYIENPKYNNRVSSMRWISWTSHKTNFTPIWLSISYCVKKVDRSNLQNSVMTVYQS